MSAIGWVFILLGVAILLLVAGAVIFRVRDVRVPATTPPAMQARKDRAVAGVAKADAQAEVMQGRVDHGLQAGGLAGAVNARKPTKPQGGPKGGAAILLLLGALAAAGTVAPAHADDFQPHVPTAPEASKDECPEAVDLVPGFPLPAMSTGPLVIDGRPTCRATVIPLSVTAHLLSIEAWAGQAEARLELDSAQAAIMQARIVELEKPVPWTQRPGVQRWVGRGETVLVFGIVGGIAWGVASAL